MNNKGRSSRNGEFQRRQCDKCGFAVSRWEGRLDGGARCPVTFPDSSPDNIF